MTTRKRPGTKEPLLNKVARKLGYAAGTLTKVTQELTENLSALPENVTTKVRDTRHRRKKIQTVTRLKRAKVATGPKKQKARRRKTQRLSLKK